MHNIITPSNAIDSLELPDAATTSVVRFRWVFIAQHKPTAVRNKIKSVDVNRTYSCNCNITCRTVTGGKLLPIIYVSAYFADIVQQHDDFAESLMTACNSIDYEAEQQNSPYTASC